MLWLCIHFPLLRLEIFTRGPQACERMPTIVIENGRVCGVNQAGLEAGIQPGHSLASANALSADLTILQRNANKERQTLEFLVSGCYRFSPMNCIQPPDTILLELSACLKYFKGLQPLLQSITCYLSDTGYSYRYGLGDTPAAAWLLARQPGSEMLAGTDNGGYRKQLEAIALHHLQLSEQKIRLFQDMGFTRLGELLELPPRSIASRFGRATLNYLQRITGVRADPRQPLRRLPAFHSVLFFMEPLVNFSHLEPALEQLLRELCHYLRHRQLACCRLDWHFRAVDDGCRTIRLQLSCAQNSLNTLLDLTRIKLSSQPLGLAVQNVSLQVSEFVENAPSSPSLFAEKPGTTSSKSSHLLLERLSARLGEAALQGISLEPQTVPEYACRSTTLRTASQSNSVTTGHTGVPALRPLWLLPTPEPIKQRRQQLWWNGNLTLIQGPERIESHWWQATPVSRDYFVARHEQGPLYWLFRDIKTRRWFLQGVFF